MKQRTIITFLSGVLATLALGGIGWYLGMKGMDTGSMQMRGMEMKDTGDTGASAQAAVMVSPNRRQLIGVKTAVVKEQNLDAVIRTVGTVDYNEQQIRQINLRVSGWITRLFADYTGKRVKKGDPLMTLYSPDLVSTQEEYLLSKRTFERVKASPVDHIRTGAEAQVESARNRLLRWNLTDRQIVELEQRGSPETETTIYSPLDGVVTQKMAFQGMYVGPEMNLYEIVDLSTVWVYADIYEYELSKVKVGQEAIVTLASYPGETFRGQLIYIYPYLNTETRTVKVRMEFPNPHEKLKPGMYGNVEIQGFAGKQLAIPQEAVLDSGTRKLVFVDKGGGVYEPREVTLANKTNRLYPVLAGLRSDEKVVTSGTFLIDSESKLMAATSMMGMLGMGGVKMEQGKMGEMEMGDMKGMKGMEGMEMAPSSTAREQTVDGLTVTFATIPETPKKGENVVRLTVRSSAGPITDATVTLGYTMTMPGMGTETVDAKQTKEGMYEATVDLAMKGGWNIDATIVRGQKKPVKTRFTVEVK